MRKSFFRIGAFSYCHRADRAIDAGPGLVEVEGHEVRLKGGTCIADVVADGVAGVRVLIIDNAAGFGVTGPAVFGQVILIGNANMVIEGSARQLSDREKDIQ